MTFEFPDGPLHLDFLYQELYPRTVIGKLSYCGVGSMFDAIWLALILGLFGAGLAYLVACDRV
jgi:hypothetical protein